MEIDQEYIVNLINSVDDLTESVNFKKQQIMRTAEEAARLGEVIENVNINIPTIVDAMVRGEAAAEIAESAAARLDVKVFSSLIEAEEYSNSHPEAIVFVSGGL